MRKVFLDELPKKNKLHIDWINCIGYKVPFVYDDIEGEIEIVGYVNSKEIYVQYLDCNVYKISMARFKTGCLGRALGKITGAFKVEIGEILKDDKRDLIITDREYRNGLGEIDKDTKYKWYRYTCNDCGWDGGWIVEGALLTQGVGCSCCKGKTVAEGINDIPTTAPWMVKYFQGGYDEAKLYTCNSNKKICPICPECGKINKSTAVNNIYYNEGISCDFCSDNISYPEKVVLEILNQLKVNYKRELTKTMFKWCGKFRYDFYLPDYNCIIETHGRQHYEEHRRKGARALEEEQTNDKLKERLAKENGIEYYVVLDCRNSEINWIKSSIISSELANMFNLSNIVWEKCEKYALSNLIKEVCECKKNNPEYSAMDISRIYNLSDKTIRDYLKKGNELEWCHYSAEEEYIKGVRRKNKWGKQVEIFKNGQSLGIFETCSELERQSERLFGINLSHSSISDVASGRRKTYKGFTFKYTNNNKENNEEVA